MRAMWRWRWMALGPWVAFLLVTGVAGAAEPPAAPAPVVNPAPATSPAPVHRAEAPAPALAGLAWMAGHWRSVEDGDVSDEVWLAPEGNAMSGMWRWVRGGRVRLFESLAIVEHAPGEAVLLLRHIRPDGASIEPAEAPLRLPLITTGPRQAVFAGVGSDGAPLRITYRSPRPDALEATVEHGAERLDYRMTRR